MPYLKNSLVISLIISVFLIIPSNSPAEDGTFILPQKKIIKNNFFKIEKKKIKNDKQITGKLLPLKKPTNQKKVAIKNDSSNDKKVENLEKKVVEPINEDKKEKKLINPKKSVESSNKFLLPIKKPISFKLTSIKVAEKSLILNSRDFTNAQEVFNLIKKKKWNSALGLTKVIKDKDFKNLITWIYLKEPGNAASFADYTNFISSNPDFPRISRLRYLAEHKIRIKNTTPKSIINWFENKEPLSGTGKIKLGEAYIESGKIELANELIKTGWITADLSSSDLRYYKKKFRKILGNKENIERADYLAWSNKYWDLKRMLRYLPKNEKLLYNARFILMTNSYGVDKAISDVPASYKNNIGLRYDRLKWRNRRNRLESSIEILENTPETDDQLIRPDLWWKQRSDITRDLIYKKNYELAYKISSNHSLSNGPEFAEAEWLSGWLALSFLKSPSVALDHFKNFYNNVGYPISLARGAYWIGRSLEDLGEIEESKIYYKEGSKFTNTYYGQLSFNKINFNGEFKIIKEFKHDKDYEKEFNKNRLIKIVKILKELDKTQYGKDIIKHLATLNIQKGSEVLAAKLSTEVDRYDFAIQISKQASYEKRFINLYNYPIITTPKEINGKIMPYPGLILSIIRQESEFDARANSYVGAKGLMQLMPGTAKLVSRQIKVGYNRQYLTTNPTYNIKLGTYYFYSLLRDYNGVYPFAIAAYNAGPNRVKIWKKKYGDPSKGDINFIDWIELIRFKETRNYVQRVIENINVYKYILNENPVTIGNVFRE